MIDRGLVTTAKSYCIYLICLLLLLSGCSAQPQQGADGIELTRVTVTRVVDGDTVHVRFLDRTEEKIRLIGVDAPEINHPVRGVEPFGLEAERYTRSILDGETVWLEFDLGERDQYGRLLAYLWLFRPQEINDQEIRDNLFNAHLLLDGYARQVIFLPNIKYVDYFSRYQDEARDQNRGLWGRAAEEITD